MPVQHRFSSRRRAGLASWALLGALLGGLLVPTAGQADRSYTVRDGDTLARIAVRHHITVRALQAANGMDRAHALRPGQLLTVPDQGVVFVRQGDTLSRIARRNDVTVRALTRLNRLRESANLRLGQRLILPGHEGAAQRSAAERRWGRPRHPGIVEFVRIASRRRLRMRLRDRRGRVRRAAVERLGPLMRARGARRNRRPHRRLVAMLSQLSDHFGGRTIYIVSGYRSAGGYTRATSQHTLGRAMDIRVRGVPNSALRDYCRRFPQAGVGYYPRSTFVHLDSRDRRTYWVDWSRPGQAPIYRRPEEGPPEQDDPDAEAEADPSDDGSDAIEDTVSEDAIAAPVGATPRPPAPPVPAAEPSTPAPAPPSAAPPPAPAPTP